MAAVETVCIVIKSAFMLFDTLLRSSVLLYNTHRAEKTSKPTILDTSANNLHALTHLILITWSKSVIYRCHVYGGHVVVVNFIRNLTSPIWGEGEG